MYDHYLTTAHHFLSTNDGPLIGHHFLNTAPIHGVARQLRRYQIAVGQTSFAISDAKSIYQLLVLTVCKCEDKATRQHGLLQIDFSEANTWSKASPASGAAELMQAMRRRHRAQANTDGCKTISSNEARTCINTSPASGAADLLQAMRRNSKRLPHQHRALQSGCKRCGETPIPNQQRKNAKESYIRYARPCEASQNRTKVFHLL